MADTQPGRQRSPAERMRHSRQRRREGTRIVPFEVRDTEISGLVAHGLLDPAAGNNRDAIAAALGALLDLIPVASWEAAMQLRAPE
jgi:hypothetical protein